MKIIYAMLFMPMIVTVDAADAAAPRSRDWNWPLDAFRQASITQDFAEYQACLQDCGHHTSGHHTGYDIGAPLGTTVRAAADGWVVGLIPNGDSGCSRTFSGQGSCRDHGYGNTLIIQHGKKLFSQYSHMDDFDHTLRDRVFGKCQQYTSDDPNGAWAAGSYHCSKSDKITVDRSDPIGTVGRSHFGGKDSDLGYHLHFEAKVFSTLSSPNAKTSFGYTAQHPHKPAGCDSKSCVIGYDDPANYLERGIDKKTLLHVKLGPDGDGVGLRLGPQRIYALQARWRVSDNKQYWAVASGENSDQCDQGWYKIINNSSFPPPIDQYFQPSADDGRDGPGSLPDTWVCIGNAGDQYVVVAP